MTNSVHFALLKDGVAVWNRWRVEHPDVRPKLNGVDLSGAELHGANLCIADLSRSILKNTNLEDADLSGADLSRANLSGAILNRADLNCADLSGAYVQNCCFRHAKLDGADLSVKELTGADFSGATLKHAELRLDTIPAVFTDADLTNAILDIDDLSAASFERAKLRYLDLSGRDLAGAQLPEADLTGVNLSYADLTGANLTGAILSDAICETANFTDSCLVRARLDRAQLGGARLCRAVLTEATLNNSQLIGTDFTGAILERVEFKDAEIGYCTLADVDLSTCLDLDRVQHAGPSSVGIDTIYKSKGQISHIFLRGLGLPDNFIEYSGPLTSQPIQFYSCFISYATEDQEFAERLYNDLQASGVRCWFAPHDIKAGKKIHEQLIDAIRVHEKLLVILSEHSLHSEWVSTELANARRREAQEAKRVLFPVRLVDFRVIEEWTCFDADARKDTAREIREYFIPDFSEWKQHEPYKVSFQRLLRDLQVEEADRTESHATGAI